MVINTLEIGIQWLYDYGITENKMINFQQELRKSYKTNNILTGLWIMKAFFYMCKVKNGVLHTKWNIDKSHRGNECCSDKIAYSRFATMVADKD